MNKFELVLVVSAKLDDEARTATVDKVKAYIERFGGVIDQIKAEEKKKLAYEIQKQTEGYYYFITFDAASDVPAQVEANVRIMEPVLRYLCVRVEA